SFPTRRSSDLDRGRPLISPFRDHAQPPVPPQTPERGYRRVSFAYNEDVKTRTVMGRSILGLLLISATCHAENRWYESRSGPIELLSDAPQRHSLATLGEAEQL